MFKKQNDKKYDEKETIPMITTFLEDIMTNSNGEKETTPWGTPRSKMGSNDVNTTTMEINSINYIWNIIQQHH